jgi:HAD superfamily hydrolase (TIGR01509 family)
VIRAVVFDIDGVLVESEELWDAARRRVVAEHGGHWRDDATTAMQGMSSPEWGAYLRDKLGVDRPVDDIVDLVVGDLLDCYRQHLPLLPGAVDAVRRIGERWPLGLASSANRVVIDALLDLAGLRGAFTVTVSSEEVPHGKPAPDVYIEAARRLQQAPRHCAAIEDSTNGIRSARTADLHVVAVPNRAYPPSDDALADADVVLDTLDQLTTDVLDRLDGALTHPSRVARPVIPKPPE